MKEIIIAQLREGKLTLPYRVEIREAFGEEVAKATTRMFEASWHHYLLNKGTISLPYWAQFFPNAVVFNNILRELSETGWLICETIPNRNWSEAKLSENKLLEFMPMDQLEAIRAYFKYQKYMLTDEVSTVNNLTKINGKIKNTGIVRNGFFKASHTQFQFDTEAIKEHYDIILKEVNKGMSKVRELHVDMIKDGASYDSVAETILESIMNAPEAIYAGGQYYADSRGRNISGMLNKVFNPIGFKVARACLVIPEDKRNLATKRGVRNKYLFIAELLGFKDGTVEDKENFGRECYYRGTVLELDWRIEAERKDYYENIWLDRIYAELDEYFQVNKGFKTRKAKEDFFQCKITLEEAKDLIETTTEPDYRWRVPIEIDMSALTN